MLVQKLSLSLSLVEAFAEDVKYLHFVTPLHSPSPLSLQLVPH